MEYKKTIKSRLLSVLIVAIISVNSGKVGTADTLHVGIDQTYNSIQSAVDAAKPYDTIIVHSGTYGEKVVVDASEGKQALTIRAHSDNQGDKVVVVGKFALEGTDPNFCENNLIEGFYVQPTDKIGCYSMFARNNTWSNIVVYSNQNMSGFGGYYMAGADIIKHCTIYNCLYPGFYRGSCDISIKNTILANCINGWYCDPGSKISSYTNWYNNPSPYAGWEDPHIIEDLDCAGKSFCTDPLFASIDRTSPYFLWLKPNSPCVNAAGDGGNIGALPVTDMEFSETKAYAPEQLRVGLGQTYRTIQSAVDEAEPSDTIMVHAGIYEEVVYLDSACGKEGLVICANIGDKVIIKGKFILKGTSSNLCENNLIKDFYIEPTSSYACYNEYARNNHWRNLVIYSDGTITGFSGTHMYGLDIIEHCTVYNCLYPGVYAYSSSAIVRNSILANCANGWKASNHKSTYSYTNWYNNPDPQPGWENDMVVEYPFDKGRCLSCDPRFASTDPDSPFFLWLQIYSACINAAEQGDNVGALPTFAMGELVKCAQDISQLTAEGNQAKASEYIDEYIKDLDREYKDLQQKPSDKTQIQLKRNRQLRAVAELLRLQMQLEAGVLTQDRWLSACKNLLQNNPDLSGESFRPILYGYLQEDQVLALIKIDMPPDIQIELVSWLIHEKSYSIKSLLENNRNLYETCFVHSSNVSLIEGILQKYYIDLRTECGGQLANEFLEQLIVLFPQSLLAQKAALLRYGNEENTGQDITLPVKSQDVPTLLQSQMLQAFMMRTKGEVTQAVDLYTQVCENYCEYDSIMPLARQSLFSLLFQRKTWDIEAIEKHLKAFVSREGHLSGDLWNYACRLWLGKVRDATTADRKSIWQQGLSLLSCDRFTISAETLADLDELIKALKEDSSLSPVTVLTDLLLLCPDLSSMKELQRRRVEFFAAQQNWDEALAGAGLEVLLSIATPEGPRPEVARFLQLMEEAKIASLSKENCKTLIFWRPSTQQDSLPDVDNKRKIVLEIPLSVDTELKAAAQNLLAGKNPRLSWRNRAYAHVYTDNFSEALEDLHAALAKSGADKTYSSDVYDDIAFCLWAADGRFNECGRFTKYIAQDLAERSEQGYYGDDVLLGILIQCKVNSKVSDPTVVISQKKLARLAMDRWEQRLHYWAGDALLWSQPEWSRLFWVMAINDRDTPGGVIDCIDAIYTKLRQGLRIADAERFLKSMIEHTPDVTAKRNLLLKIALLLHDQGKFKECLETLIRADTFMTNKEAEQDIAVGFIRAMSLIRTRDFTQAIALLNDMQTWPGTPEQHARSLFLLGWIYLQNNNVEQSLLALQGVVDKYPRTAAARKAKQLAAHLRNM